MGSKFIPRRKHARSTTRLRDLAIEQLEARIALHAGGFDEFDVLIFSRTAGFRHNSISAGIETIEQLGVANGFHTIATEDPIVFQDQQLAEFEAVVFLNTTGDILNGQQQAAFERYVQSGGGYVGVHSAADTEYQWSWYGDLVGAYFAGHPPVQTATVEVIDRVHPSTADLPERWTLQEEWYNYRINPRGNVHVLATLDESTYEGGTMGFDHPIAWAHEYDGGRAWYTGLGHQSQTFRTKEMQSHLLGGIQFAAGAVQADVGATIDQNYRKVVLDENTDDPMQMDIAADGRVFYAQRGGTVRVYDPVSDSTQVVGRVSVTEGGEDGLLGLTLDPDFGSNGHVYLFYSPPTANENRVARFTVEENRFSGDSEKILLRIPSQHACCHSGGGLEFGADGLLYIGVGDHTNPFQSDGYAPIDERAGRQSFDAQRSAGNADDLRGKILRIRPEADGTYSIPEGNLFPADGSIGRPEIFVMGNRNPFRFSVDSETSWLYWGEVGPDASGSDSQRGPAGHDEFNQAREAGNFGWPYFIADNIPYVDYDFSSRQSSDPFDPAAPVNDSPNNTGPQQLPPAKPALIWYDANASEEFPELGRGGRTAMAGPVYHFDAALATDHKLPEYFDDTLFIYEWSRHWIKEVKLDQAGNILAINPFLPSLRLRRPMDMEIGPDGAIYLLEWGVAFSGGGNDSLLSRIEYVGSPSSQLAAVANADVDNGSVPLTVSFSAEESIVDAGPASYAWDFDSDGVTDSTDPTPSFTYEAPGNYVARLTVTNSLNQSDVASVDISAGNQRPEVVLSLPPNGAFFDWGETIDFRAQVTDLEDGSSAAGTILAADFIVQPLLGHDSHGHPQEIYNVFAGSFVAPQAGHGEELANLYLAIEARYADKGGDGVDSLTGAELHVLQPRHKQAEHFTNSAGIATTESNDPDGGGEVVSSIGPGDYFSFSPIHLGDVNSIRYRLGSPRAGSVIELRLDSPAGDLLTTHVIDVTANEFVDFVTAVPSRNETHELFFVFLGTEQQLAPLSVNWLEFAAEALLLPGDTNLDGLVDFTDFLALSANFGKTSGMTRAEGDFDGDQDVDFRDFLVLSTNFGKSLVKPAPLREASEGSHRLQRASDAETIDLAIRDLMTMDVESHTIQSANPTSFA